MTGGPGDRGPGCDARPVPERVRCVPPLRLPHPSGSVFIQVWWTWPGGSEGGSSLVMGRPAVLVRRVCVPGHLLSGHRAPGPKPRQDTCGVSGGDAERRREPCARLVRRMGQRSAGQYGTGSSGPRDMSARNVSEARSAHSHWRNAKESSSSCPARSATSAGLSTMTGARSGESLTSCCLPSAGPVETSRRRHPHLVRPPPCGPACGLDRPSCTPFSLAFPT